MGRIIKFFITFSIFAFLVVAVFAYYLDILPTNLKLHPEVYKSSGIAIAGYDVVNYQNKKTANKGNVTYKFKYNDTHWIFMSNVNLKKFVKRPKKYLPQYGGYCTYSISEGYTYPPNPEIWRFFKGRLYFFKDEESKKIAISNWDEIIERANKNWN